jgi:hypothetical protein
LLALEDVSIDRTASTEGGQKEMKSKCLAVIKTAIIFSALLLSLMSGALAQEKKAETAQQAVARALLAHSGKWADGSITDWVGRGKIRITGDENGSLDFTLAVKGKAKAQRVIKMPGDIMLRYGSDGKKSWQSSGMFSGDAVGRTAQIVECLTDRSVAGLFDNASQKKTYSDLDVKQKKFVSESAASRAIAVQDEKGKTTNYYIDNASSMVTRLEFDTGGTFRMLFGEEEYPLMAAFVFSDYRTFNGVMMPYKIEVYQGLVKIEEMIFDSIEFNTGLSDDEFVP